jgi:hypothetical protein
MYGHVYMQLSPPQIVNQAQSSPLIHHYSITYALCLMMILSQEIRIAKTIVISCTWTYVLKVIIIIVIGIWFGLIVNNDNRTL